MYYQTVLLITLLLGSNAEKVDDLELVVNKLRNELDNVVKELVTLKDELDHCKNQTTTIVNQDNVLRNEMNVIKSEIDQITGQNQNLTKLIEGQQVEISKLHQATVPIGFLYTQLPNQTIPSELWPTLQWLDVTQQFAGLFFRAEGSGSSPFGQIQQANQSWISTVRTSGLNDGIEMGPCQPGDVTLKQTGWTEFINCQPGKQFPLYDFFGIYTTDAEVRPKNTAIKIWKRVK